MSKPEASHAVWETRPRISAPNEIGVDSFAFPGKCGSNWNAAEIRQPYKNIDFYVDNLPRLVGHGREDRELSHVIEQTRVVREWVEDGILEDAIDDAQNTLDRYDMDANNRVAIQAYIDQARIYAEHAGSLWNWWSRVFIPGKTPTDPTKAPHMVHATGAPHWLLSSKSYPGCPEGEPWPKVGSIAVTHLENSQYGGGRDFLDVACPYDYEINGHRDDSALYRSLVVAAVNSARCASEAASAVGIFYKNRSRIAGKILAPKVSKFPSAGSKVYAPRANGSGGGSPSAGPGSYMTLQPGEPRPPIVEPPEGIPGGGIGGEMPSPGEPLTPDTTPAVSKPAKKKDNTILIAAAAGAALLILGRK